MSEKREKEIVAQQELDIDALKVVLAKKCQAHREGRAGS